MVISEAAETRYRPLSRAQIEPALERYGITFPYLLYVGSLESRKNLARLLQAYSRVRSLGPKLVIVGARRWKFSPIIETVEQLELESDVHFTGFVEEEDLPALYNGAELFLFPSLYEGFGLPVLEALSCGTPVITSNSSSLPEVAGEAAILVDPYSVSAIATAILQVLSNPELATMMREKGLAQAQAFSWERTASETLAIYQNVLSNNGVGASLCALD